MDPMKNEPHVKISHIAVVAGARIAQAKEAEAEAKAEVTEQKKWAKTRGVNLKALEAVRTAMKEDKFQEFVDFCRDGIAYANAFGRPVPRDQLDIFETADVQLPLDEAAYAKGHAAGLADEGTQTCIHGIETPAGQKWMDGWHQGQKIRALVLTVEPKDELIKGSEPEDTDPEGDE